MIFFYLLMSKVGLPLSSDTAGIAVWTAINTSLHNYVSGNHSMFYALLENADTDAGQTMEKTDNDGKDGQTMEKYEKYLQSPLLNEDKFDWKLHWPLHVTFIFHRYLSHITRLRRTGTKKLRILRHICITRGRTQCVI